MRVLMLAQFYPPIIGGEERHVKALSEGLAQRGHDVSVATIRHGDDPTHEVVNDVGVHRLQGTLQRASNLFAPDGRRHAAPFPDPELMIGVHRIIAAQRPDVVHAHNWMVHSFLPMKIAQPAGLVVTLHDYSLVCAKKSLMHSSAPASIARACAGPSLASCLPCTSTHYGTLKGMVTTLTHGVSGRMQRWLTDAFIAVSSAVAERNGLNRHSTPHSVIPNFVPDDIAQLSPEFEPYLDQLPTGDFLLFVGDLMKLKGIDTLLAAYARLANAPPLVLIGRRCPDTPQTLPRGVIMLDAWPHGAIMQAWSRCLFGILPSRGLEACATVVMEANALGKPMIVTRTGGLPELVTDGVTGLIVPPGDADALTTALQRLIEDVDLRDRLSRACRASVESFKAHSVVPRVEGIYRDVLARRRAGKPTPTEDADKPRQHSAS